MKKNNSLVRSLLVICLFVVVPGCGGGSGNASGNGAGNGDNTGGGGNGNGNGNDDGGNTPSPAGSKGIIFVAQTPAPSGTSDIGTHTATFGNGQPSIDSAVRGGSLHFLEADGTLRDLLDEALKNGCKAGGNAICDANGSHEVNDAGLLVGGYVVRRPRIHWNADKVMFSMTGGAKHEQFGDIIPGDPLWQLYEITGLDPEDTPLLTKVASQPAFNNFDGIYGSNGKIFFISDKPVTGNSDHYPQLDEYESLPINTGLWKLDPETGDVQLMDHSPSGDFGPEITPSGHVIFTRWDHLQRDQQAENSKEVVFDGGPEDFWGAYTYGNENDSGNDDYRVVETVTRENLQTFIDSGKTDAAALAAAANGDEIFPEPVRGNPFYNWGNKDGTVAGTFNGEPISYSLPETEYGAMNPLRFNHFLPWQIRQDGLRCETYRHTGLHETGGFIEKALRDDPNLRDIETTAVRIPDGFFLNQVFDDPDTGFETVTGVVAPEFGTHKAGSILQFIDTQASTKPALHENGDAVEYAFLTDPENGNFLYRDPVFLSDGRLVAAVSKNPGPDDRSFDAFDFRLFVLKKNAETGYYEPGEPLLAKTLSRNFDFWEENGGLGLREFNGALWEIEAQEVIARPEPAIPAPPLLDDPELDAFAAAGVTPEAFRQYLRDNKLAAIVIRNATTRDGADVNQPFNLVVENADGQHEKTVGADFEPGTDKVYPITYLQLMRGDYLRGYMKFAEFENGTFVSDGGRRILANELAMTGELANNPDAASGAPLGAVPIQPDGSIAALVPALRAMTWQLIDDDGDPVVRERYWLTFQPGEVRVCASCHGINDSGQDGKRKPLNSPDALQKLLVALREAGEF